MDDNTKRKPCRPKKITSGTRRSERLKKSVETRQTIPTCSEKHKKSKDKIAPVEKKNRSKKPEAKTPKIDIHQYPTFPYPPLGHAHQRFEIPSPLFELVTDPIIPEPVLPDIDIPEIGAEIEISLNSPTEWNGWQNCEENIVREDDRDTTSVKQGTLEEIVEDETLIETQNMATEGDQIKADKSTIVISKSQRVISEVQQLVKEIIDGMTDQVEIGTGFREADKDVRGESREENVYAEEEEEDGIEAAKWGIDIPKPQRFIWKGNQFVAEMTDVIEAEFEETEKEPRENWTEENLYDDLFWDPAGFEEAEKESGENKTEVNLYDDLFHDQANSPIIRSVVIIPVTREIPKTPALTEEDIELPLIHNDQQLEAEQKVVVPVMIHEEISVPNIRQPLHSLAGRLLSERLPENDTWYALKTSPPRGEETPGFIPTHWLPVNSNYWQEIHRLRRQKFGNVTQLRMSTRDAAYIKVELVESGEVYVTRLGQRAKIHSALGDPNSDNGDQRLFTPVPRAKGPQGSKPKHVNIRGVKTQDLSTDCPYWARLVKGLVYPESGAAPVPRESDIDNANCLVYIEHTGRVCVQRWGYRVELLPQI